MLIPGHSAHRGRLSGVETGQVADAEAPVGARGGQRLRRGMFVCCGDMSARGMANLWIALVRPYLEYGVEPISGQWAQAPAAAEYREACPRMWHQCVNCCLERGAGLDVPQG